MDVNGTTFTYGSGVTSHITMDGYRGHQHVHVTHSIDGGSVSMHVTGNLQTVNNSSQPMAGKSITIGDGNIVKRNITVQSENITIEGKTTLEGNVKSTCGHIFIKDGSKVKGAVSSVSGNIKIEGGSVVKGTVNSMSGTVSVCDTSFVKGAAMSMSGDVIIESTARITGAMTSMSGSVKVIPASTPVCRKVETPSAPILKNQPGAAKPLWEPD